MNSLENNDPNAEKEIHALIEEWSKYLHEKNADRLVQKYTNETVTFDVGTQRKGQQQIKQLWVDCFPYFQGDVNIERKNLTVHVEGNLAIMHCYSKLSADTAPSKDQSLWVRSTVCYRKIEEQWKVIHDHISVPVDFMEGKPIQISESDIV